MSLPNGVIFANGEVQKLQKAIAELEKDQHAPRKMSIDVILCPISEYPKHVTLIRSGEVKVAQNAEEEQAILAAAEPQEPQTGGE